MCEEVNIEYANGAGTPHSWRKLIRIGLPVLALCIALVAIASTAERRTHVDYQTGLIRNSLYVLSLPIRSRQTPIFDAVRNDQSPAAWRLMSSEPCFWNAGKQETSEARVVSDLRMTLQAVSLAKGSMSNDEVRALTNAAWQAAAAGDIDKLEAIQSSTEAHRQ